MWDGTRGRLFAKMARDRRSSRGRTVERRERQAERHEARGGGREGGWTDTESERQRAKLSVSVDQISHSVHTHADTSSSSMRMERVSGRTRQVRGRERGREKEQEGKEGGKRRMAQEVGEDKRVIEIRVLLLPRMCMKHSPPHSLALTLSSHRLPCSPALILTLTQRVPLRLQRQQPARVAGESRLAGRYTRCHSSSPAPDTTHAGTDGESAGALAHVPCLLSLSPLFRSHDGSPLLTLRSHTRR